MELSAARTGRRRPSGGIEHELTAAEVVSLLGSFRPAALVTSSGHWHSTRDRAQLAAEAFRLGFDGVEWSAQKETLPELAAFLRSGVRGRASVHASADDAALLGILPETVAQVVLHPDTLDDLDAVRALGGRAALENMDAQKLTGRTPEELAGFFAELPEARLCLDVAHAAHHDPTLELGFELAGRFQNRLSQLHISVLAPDCWHLPLTAPAVERFAPLLERCRHVPWVVEAPWADGPCDPHSCELCARHRVLPAA